jgi:hypothetical protein
MVSSAAKMSTIKMEGSLVKVSYPEPILDVPGNVDFEEAPGFVF